MMIDFIIINQS